MSDELKAALINAGIKWGLDAAIELARNIGKPGATIDDAIAALESVKTMAQLKAEAP